MSSTVNKVILIGNIGADPEVRYLDNDRAVARFSIATDESYIDSVTQEKKKMVHWHPIVCWNAKAIFADNHLKKGMKIYVEGKLSSKSWQDDKNYTVYQNEIVVDEIKILATPQSSSENKNKSNYPNDEGVKPSKIINKELFNLNDDDLLPF